MTQARKRRVDRVMVRLARTLGCEVGVNAQTLDEVPFRTAADPMDRAPPLYTGDKTLTVVGIAPRVTAYD